MINMRPQVRALLSAIPLILAISCVFPPLKPDPITYPPISADEAISILNETNDAIVDLKGIAKIKTINSKGILESSVTGYLAFKNPSMLRFTYIGPMGMILFEAVIKDDDIVLFLPQDLMAYSGKLDRSGNNLFYAYLLKTPFSTPVGETFLIDHKGAESTLSSMNRVNDSLELVEKITIDRKDMTPRLRELYSRGVATARIEYLEYEDFSGILVPTKLVITDLIEDVKMKLSLREVKVNNDVSEDIFETEVGEPWNVQPLDRFIPPNF